MFVNAITDRILLLDRPLRDNLNAGQSGAVAMNLDFELDYLIPRMYHLVVV